jgi:hypothetical protein
LSKVCRRMGDDKKAKHFNNIAKSLDLRRNEK